MAWTRKQIRESAALDLGWMKKLAATTIDTTAHTVKVPRLVDQLPDQFLLRDAFIMPRMATDTGNEWNRIEEFSTPETPDVLKLASGPDGLVANDDVGIYFMLDPDEMNDCLNQALSEIWKSISISVTFIAGQNEYVLGLSTDEDGDLATWLTTKGQIERVEYKSVVSSAPTVRTEEAAIRIIESNNVVSVFQPFGAYGVSSTDTLVVRANKPYVYPGRELTTDIAPVSPATTPYGTTTCPFPLAMTATQVKMLKKAFAKYGSEQMRPRYGAMIAIKEQELARQKLIYQPPMRMNSYTIDEAWAPDIPVEMLRPAW